MKMNGACHGLLVAVLLMTFGAAQASEVIVGESLEDVIADRGQPRGFIRSGGYLLLDYEHGKVELRDDKVVRAELLTDEELAAYREHMAKRNLAAARAAAARRAALIAEGTKVRNDKLADPGFMASPASDQVAFWRWFRQKYPAVDVGGEYAVVLQKYEAELAEQSREAARRQEIAELEARAADAERAAADAQREAEIARAYGYYYSSYSYPVCYVKPAYRCAPLKPQPLPVATPNRSATLTWAVGPSVMPPASTQGTTIGWLAWER
jgi:hypothetical protein